MPNEPTAVTLKIRVDSDSTDDAVGNLHRWLTRDPQVGRTGAVIERGSVTTTRSMSAADWLEVTAKAASVVSAVQVIALSLAAWRRSRRPVEAKPSVVIVQLVDREIRIDYDDEKVRRELGEHL